MICVDGMTNFYGEEVNFYGFDFEESAIIAIWEDGDEIRRRTFKNIDRATTFFYRRGWTW